MAGQAKDVDQASAALVMDLKQRGGMLEDTLVIWGGEFGRGNYCKVNLTLPIMVGTITQGHLVFGWPEAVLNRVLTMGRPMSLVTM